MSDVGVVRCDPKSKTYYVDLTWKGKRERIYRLPILGGGLLACRTEEMGEYLRRLINDQITQGIFRPERFKQKKPLHLKSYALVWVEKQTHLMRSSHRDYHGYINNYIIPKLGDVFLNDLNEGLLEDFQRELTVAPKTKKNIMGCFMKILRDAERHGDIDRSPKKPPLTGSDKVIDPEIVWLEPEEQDKIIEKIPEKHRPVFLFMMLSGCRPSEARALRWQDIKWDHEEIIMSMAFDYREKLVPVKGKKILPIPMTEGLKYLLSQILRNLSEYVFINPNTGRRYTHNFKTIWSKACTEALGQPVKLYHSTRHSFASQLVNAGLDIAIVQRLLRHTDPRTTKRYYEYKTAPLKIAVEQVRSIHDVRKNKGFVSKLSVNEKGG